MGLVPSDHFKKAANEQYRIVNAIKRPVVYHSLFWAVYFVLNTLRWGSYFDDYFYSLKSNLVEFPIHVALVYFNLYYLLPKFVPKNFFKYLTFLAFAILLFTCARILLTYELVTTEIYKESAVEETSLFAFNYVLAVYIGELYVVGLTTGIKLMVDWVNSQKRTRELEKRNHETELAYLRSQLQPHFFFNTLNNLYSLTLEKSDTAPEMVLKLSELMSYVVYRGKCKSVSLYDEIKHIQNYLDLEKIRYGRQLNAHLGISGEIGGKNLPPLLLIPLVENSFKHGILLKNGKIPVGININVNGKRLEFSTENLKAGTLPEKGPSGIGIENTMRRLELLYHKNFNLKIENNLDTFKVVLNIPLDEDQMPDS